MPAFNEAGSIRSFLEEIRAANFGDNLSVIVIDDCSSDDTVKQLVALEEKGFPLRVVSNSENMGHGPSTIKALRAGLESNSDVVIATDGDGQIRARDLLAMAKRALDKNAVVEGVRVDRRDQWFRALTSLATRLLVGMRAGAFPRDANTPYRAYPSHILRSMLEDVNPAAMTPNLLLSALTRMRSIPLLEHNIQPFVRQGSVENGVTWKQNFKLLPSKRFLRFVWLAALQWGQIQLEAPAPKTTSQKFLTGLIGRGSAGRYALIGVSGVSIDFLAYALFIWLGLHPVLSTLLSTPLGILNNYVWNSRLNFRMALSKERGARFLVVGISGLVASALLISSLSAIGATALVAKMCSIPLVVFAQFLLNKFWTFSIRTSQL